MRRRSWTMSRSRWSRTGWDTWGDRQLTSGPRSRLGAGADGDASRRDPHRAVRSRTIRAGGSALVRDRGRAYWARDLSCVPDRVDDAAVGGSHGLLTSWHRAWSGLGCRALVGRLSVSAARPRRWSPPACAPGGGHGLAGCALRSLEPRPL